MEDLKSIIEEFQKAVKETGLKKVSDDMLFDCAVRRLNTLKCNSGSTQAPTKTFKDLNALATEGQVSYLKKLGLKEIPAGLTKIDADQLIKEKLANKNQGRQEEADPEDY